MSSYSFAHIIHLFCAIIFVGGVFFETLILSALHTNKVSPQIRKQVDPVLSARATKVMPWVVGLLFASGLIMVQRYLHILEQPLISSFGVQLMLKIILAVSILIHFMVAVYKMKTHTLTAAWSRYIHRAVLLQMILIVLLAKTMFVVSW